MSLADQIRARGHWLTIIRPSQYVAERLDNLNDIALILDDLAIKRRGWYFPHVNLNDLPQFGNDWVGQDTVFGEFRELWRVMRSGQFLHLGGVRFDWGISPRLSPMQQIEPNVSLMGIGDSLHRLSEIFEFARSWENAVCPAESVELKIQVGGLLKRQLVVDSHFRTAGFMPYVSQVGEPFDWKGQIEPGTSLEDAWMLARDAAVRLFARFGFKADSLLLEDWQRKIGQ